MNIGNIFPWRGRAAVAVKTIADVKPRPQVEEQLLPGSQSLEEAEAAFSDLEAPPPGNDGPALVTHGYLSNPHLLRFFSENYFGLGVHNGANLRTLDSLEQGKAQIAARFQNALAQLAQATQAKLDKLRDKEIETQGVCEVTTRRLQYAASVIEKELQAYEEQAQLATKHEGWVAESIHRYHMGFRKGLSQAVAFDLLSK